MKGTGKLILKLQHSNTKRVTNFNVLFNETVENNDETMKVRNDKVFYNVKS